MPKWLALSLLTVLTACDGISPVTPRSFDNPQGTLPDGSYDPLERGNLPPVVVALEMTTPAETAVEGRVVAVDPDGDATTLALAAEVTAGTLDFDDADGRFRYTPEAGFVGTDAFLVEASDGTTSATGEVRIRVLAPEIDTAPTPAVSGLALTVARYGHQSNTLRLVWTAAAVTGDVSWSLHVTTSTPASDSAALDDADGSALRAFDFAATLPTGVWWAGLAARNPDGDALAFVTAAVLGVHPFETSAATGLSTPVDLDQRGIAIWIADAGDRVGSAYLDRGNLASIGDATWPTTVDAAGVAAADDGSRVVLTDSVSGLIHRYAGSGEYDDSLTGATSPGSPWIADDGALWVPDAADHQVLIYAAGSTVPVRIGRTDRTAGAAVGEFNAPAAVDGRAGDPRVWILDAGNARIIAADPAPSLVTAVAVAGCGAGADACRGLAVAPDGYIYLARASGVGTPALYVLAPDGMLFDTLPLSPLPGGGVAGGPADLAGIDIDPTGRLAISAPLDGAIYLFER